MATRSTTRKSGDEKPSAKKAALKEVVANGPEASAEARPSPEARTRLRNAGEANHDAGEAAPCTRSHIPNARTRNADAGKSLNTYADADDLFKKLGITPGEEEA